MITDVEASPDPPEIAPLLAEFVGGLAFDIGGNVGWAARILAERFVRVLSFEPCMESFGVLRDSVPDNVQPFCMAVSSVDGDIELVEFSNHIAEGQLATIVGNELEQREGPGGWGVPTGTRVVAAMTVDRLAELYGPPDMIKCDVEGHEGDVFAGAVVTLVSHQPDLYIEVHSVELGEALEAMLRPVYGDDLRQVRHPHYAPGSFAFKSHWWWIVHRR